MKWLARRRLFVRAFPPFPSGLASALSERKLRGEDAEFNCCTAEICQTRSCQALSLGSLFPLDLTDRELKQEVYRPNSSIVVIA